MNDDDDDHNLLLLGKHGRSKGNSNFKIDKDVKLASVYVFVTTNAAIGTDQDSITFWQKIRDNFVRRGGLPTRTLVSLKNRFNRFSRPRSTSILVIYIRLSASITMGGLWVTMLQKQRRSFISKLVSTSNMRLFTAL
jgi:hypothetical protein